ncbi:SURF1 family cytochrome oxidase biogenesis protein [Blastomonas marina]|uniref:SURF1 family cytochrome oxidase biogenesis protein n=1 Tax=Blastomonas marina TaxID=1867408 RepID=UPI002AC9257E|nr:SURF1 family cytochrome oxidase biogenesis protein [Blastomonas marina]WPZ04042.1 SURF1 family cytochrome oxidase biogenesis protein [Blastomonas marina]
MRRLPIIPTIVVAAAVATMIALGIWQLGRGAERDRLKQAMVERPTQPLLDYPFGKAGDERYLFRRLRATCDEVTRIEVAGGKDAAGRTGWRQIATCVNRASGASFQTQIGVAERPDTVVEWDGGVIEGLAAQGPDDRGFLERLSFRPSNRAAMIVASEPKAGLKASRQPDPAEYENTSWAYAGQWFFFAFTALVIYAFALRRRWRERA